MPAATSITVQVLSTSSDSQNWALKSAVGVTADPQLGIT